MYCHDLEVMGSNPGWVELGLRSASVKVIAYLSQKEIPKKQFCK